MTGKYNNGIPEGTRATLSGYEWLHDRFQGERAQKNMYITLPL
jgi:hypothetical protein